MEMDDVLLILILKLLGRIGSETLIRQPSNSLLANLRLPLITKQVIDPIALVIITTVTFFRVVTTKLQADTVQKS